MPVDINEYYREMLGVYPDGNLSENCAQGGAQNQASASI